MRRFTDYKEAHTAAVLLARQCQSDVGIRKAVEFGRMGYNIGLLPRPEHRQGDELRAEVVKPTDPV